MPTLVNFMGVALPLASQEELWSAIEQATTQKPVRIATVNPEFILEARRNSEFKAALADMTHCIVDGFGLQMALQLWQLTPAGRKALKGLPIHRFPGADLVNQLIHRSQNGEHSFFLLGGPTGLAKSASQALNTTHPNLMLAGSSDGGTIPTHQVSLDPKIREELNKSQPDILLVGFGAPKQELWIQAAHQSAVSIPLMIGVGGTFGFYVSKRRAPKLIRSLGLEWLWRSLTEPGHWRRAWRAVIIFPLESLGWILSNWS